MSNSFNEKLDEVFDDDYFNADQAKQAIRDLILSEIGEDWPAHCEPFEANCRQCINREQRNYQKYELRNKILKGE